jgi:hypothetical protein
MNDMTAVLRHRSEFARAIRNRQFEITPAGVVFPRQGAFIGGAYDVEHRREGDVIGRDLSPNLIVTEGLNHVWDALVHGGTQYTTWYVALFEGNVTPGATLTAATFTSTTTECTAYDESTRVAYVEGAPSAGAIDNSASRAVFTMNATKTIYGGALLTASAKSATTGVLLGAAKFSASRAVLAADQLSVKYSLSATST